MRAWVQIPLLTKVLSCVSFLSQQSQNVYNIVYSQAVTHPSTNTTQCCLTSVIFFYIYLLIIVVKQHLMAAYIFVASHSQQQICQTIVVNYPGSFTKICLSDLMFIIWFQTMRETSYHHPDTTTSCIPRRSPIQVLTRLNVA